METFDVAYEETESPSADGVEARYYGIPVNDQTSPPAITGALDRHTLTTGSATSFCGRSRRASEKVWNQIVSAI